MARTAHATLLEKQRRGIELHDAGHSYDEIAHELGYSGRGAAWKAIDRGLRAQRDLRAGDYLTTQIDRYEAILRQWWEAGTTGHDAKAANILLRTLERLDRVLRLTDGEHAVSQETLVISADPEAYARQLQQVVGEREQHAQAGR
jgi:hypothetical protein